MRSKVCVKCEKEKPFTDFYKNSSKTDKLDNTCKVCKNERVKDWYHNQGGKEKQKEYSRKSHEKKKYLKPPKVKKEKIIKPKKPKSNYGVRIYLTVTETEARNIDAKCREFNLDRVNLIRELIKNFLDKLEYSKPTKLELLPININDFTVIGYSKGLEK